MDVVGGVRLVGGSEASGMWADLEVTPQGVPAIKSEA